MQESGTSGKPNPIIMYATRWCGDCRMARHWFDSHGIVYEYVNIEEDEHAVASVMQLNGGMRSVPTIVFPDGSILVEPSARELAAKCLPESEQTSGTWLKRLLKR